MLATPPRPMVQFHGKWPFRRLLGMQEPFSVLFSLFNYLAHARGLAKVRRAIPASYPLRGYYEKLAHVSMASWVCSMLFHTRDFPVTEHMDYFAAGANVMYGVYYTAIRVFRLDRGGPGVHAVRRAWTVLCAVLFAAHVAYLCYTWNYVHNMVVHVVAGALQNIMWTSFSFRKYRESRQAWALWPGIVVTSVGAAMSLELLDFPPLGRHLDAHSLWHLATVFPTILFYKYVSSFSAVLC